MSLPPTPFAIFICISGRFVTYCTFISNELNIVHTLEGSSPASKDSSRRLSRLDVACILIWVFAPSLLLLCSHSALTAETFPSSAALSACQSEQSGDRGRGRSSREVAVASVAVAAAAAAALGGDHSAGILGAGSPRELRRVGWAAVGADRGAEAPPTRALVYPLPLLRSQPTSKVFTQEKDKGSNCRERCGDLGNGYDITTAPRGLGVYVAGNLLTKQGLTLALQFSIWWQLKLQRRSKESAR